MGGLTAPPSSNKIQIQLAVPLVDNNHQIVYGTPPGRPERVRLMHCPYCSHGDSRVTDSRETESAIRRRRECLECQRRFTTYERVQTAPLMVRKRDGRREQFNREKMISGLRLACAKRPVSPRDIERIVDEIEAEFQQSGSGEVTSDGLGTAVMDRLRDLDRVAYIRFASVHRDFQEIESFEKAVRDLRDGTQQLPLLDMPPPDRPRARGRRRAGQTLPPRNGAADGADPTEGNSPEEPVKEIVSEAVGTLGDDKE